MKLAFQVFIAFVGLILVFILLGMYLLFWGSHKSYTVDIAKHYNKYGDHLNNPGKKQI